MSSKQPDKRKNKPSVAIENNRFKKNRNSPLVDIPDLVVGKIQANVVAGDEHTRWQLLYIQEVELIRFEKARLLLKVKLICNTGLDI